MAFLNTIFIDLWTYTSVNRYFGDPTPRRSTEKNYTLHVGYFFEHTLKATSTVRGLDAFRESYFTGFSAETIEKPLT